MDNTKEINGTVYTLKLFPTMAGLEIISKMERLGAMSPEIIFDVVTKGAAIGSVSIDRKKFDSQFSGKYGELMELFAEILRFNKLFPEAEAEGESGNDDGSAE